MSTIYSKGSQQDYDLLNQALTSYHEDLHDLEIRVGIRMVRSVDEKGQVQPAIKMAGSPVLAKITLVTAQQAVFVPYDAIIDIDDAMYEELPEKTKLAMYDHELTHLVLDRDKDGGIKLNSEGRPRLKIQQDDWTINGFRQVVQRHKENSVEYHSFMDLCNKQGDILLGADSDAVTTPEESNESRS